jgi:hypothetical protein
MEAIYGVCGRVKNLKELVRPYQSKYRIRGQRHADKLNVAIAFQGFFETTEEKINHGFVQMPDIRTVEHKVGPANIHAAFDLASKIPRLLFPQSFWQLHHGYRTLSNCHMYPSLESVLICPFRKNCIGAALPA